MKNELTFAVTLFLLAFSSSIVGSAGSIVVDIVGSTADNVLVESGSESVELEIVGGTASNVIITPPKPVFPQCCCGSCCSSDERCDNTKPSYPWDEMHLGVDAWYGTFWYTDVNMPKWPQL